MARDPRISMEQQAEENSVQFALAADFGLATLLAVIGFLGGSLTITAEAIRGALMDLVELFSLIVLKRIHREELADMEFGTGKLEQVANIVIGAAMLSGALWIGSRIVAVLTGASAPGTPFGLAMAAVGGALNLYINFLSWDRVRHAVRAESSIIMQGQLRSRRVKLFSSLFVLVTMTVAATSTDDRVVAWADVLGSLFVVGFIVTNAYEMLSAGLIDLLDRSAGPKVRDAIDRALARHADDYGELARVRSRRSGRVIFIELALRFDPSLSLAQINQRIDALRQSLSREIEHADISVLALAATR